MLNHLLLFLRPVVPRQVQWETFRSCLELLRDFCMHMNRDEPPYVHRRRAGRRRQWELGNFHHTVRRVNSHVHWYWG